MTFQAILESIVAECDDIYGAVLMGTDGIPIAETARGNIADGPLAEEIGTAGVEFTRILEEIGKASDALAGGPLSEASIFLGQFVLLFRAIDDETFLSVVLSPDGNVGKARYLIRRYQLAIRQEL